MYYNFEEDDEEMDSLSGTTFEQDAMLIYDEHGDPLNEDDEIFIEDPSNL